MNATPLARPAMPLNDLTVMKYAIVANGTVTFNATSRVDSYNSISGSYSTTNSSSNGNILMQGNNTCAISSGKLYGYVFVPTDTTPAITITANTGSIGDLVYVDGGQTGIQPGHIISMSFVSSSISSSRFFNTASQPYSSGLSVAVDTPITASGDYLGSSLSIGSGHSLQISASCRIVFTGNFSTSGTGKMVISSSCSVRLFIKGSISISGTGIQNLSQIPQDCTLYNIGTGTPSIGGSTFYGGVESQASNVTVATDIFGYVIGKSVSLSGAGRSVHFDTAVTRSL